MTDVSIIIPTFDRENTVVRAISSCIDGNNLAIEVIVVDDGSTDNTRQKIMDSYPGWTQYPARDGFSLKKNGKIIRFVVQANGGAPSARNNGMNHCSGRYIKFLDSDDFLITGALETEFKTAEMLGSQALITGWILLYLDRHGNEISRQNVDAPDLANGIDDMLDGKGPCASAGFYLRKSISHLRWDESITKAQDWMWAWTVCLDGVEFSRLDIPSSCYLQYAGEDRITQQGNPALRSTEARLNILKKVQTRLTENNQLTPARAAKLAQYYYKDARVLCENNRAQWDRLYKRIHQLAPAYRVKENSRLVQMFLKVFGLHKGIVYYVWVKSIVKKMLP